jgi:hypothetical protein
MRNDDEDNIWTRKVHRTILDDAEDLADYPQGGRGKQWIAGGLLAAIPIIYGVICIVCGHATLFGNRGSTLDVQGAAGVSLAIAYIALGSFAHFHYFWGLSQRFWGVSFPGKVISALVFVPALVYALYRIWVFE